jgi:hypothetical protein
MINLLIKTPLLGILTALLAVVAEQLLAVFSNLFWKKEIIFSSYNQIGFFLISAVVIEEGLKYLAIKYPIRKNFGLRRKKFITGSIMTGLFFGLTEVAFVAMSNGDYLTGLKAHDPEILFSFFAIILIQTLTAFLIGSLIASHIFSSRFTGLKTLFFPVFIHLLFNFLIIQKGNFTDWLLVITLAITFLISIIILAFNFEKLD